MYYFPFVTKNPRESRLPLTKYFWYEEKPVLAI